MSAEFLEVFVIVITITLVLGKEMLVRRHRGHDALGLGFGVIRAAETLN